MSTVPIAELREDIAAVCNRVLINHESFVVNKHGKPVMAVIPVDNLETLAKIENAARMNPLRGDNEDIPITQVRGRIADICVKVLENAEVFVVTKHGNPVMALIPVQSYEAIKEMERVLNALEAVKALKEAEEKGFISLEELRERYGI